MTSHSDNQQEGPHTRNVPGHTELSCVGCKWHESRMRKSGRDPIYQHFCKHSAVAPPFWPGYYPEQARYIGLNDTTPGWCPVINKESEDSD